MNEKKPSILDDVVEGIRRLLEEIERAINPDKQRRQDQPVPVPVPVEPDRRLRRDPYR